ncbi:MAG: protein kinase [Anaerolineales bacterium]|jgi:serine/threonine-protein kinase
MAEETILNNRYKLNTLIGRGGMAMVYKGTDLMLEREVAIKLLRSRYAKDPAFRERFRQEAKAAANLSHTNIVTVYDFGFDQSRLYIVMEYVSGKDLNTIIQQRGRLSIEKGLDLGIKACKGIGYAHRAGLVHCDVKPHNLIITPDWQVKVTDFGIARALASINPDELTDVVWGSPQFFSPEQAGGAAPSPASDVYSLGVILYLMFTGQLPFIGKTSEELAKMHREASPIPPKEINPFIPETLQDVILKVLAKEPSARYRTADQLGRVLQIVMREIEPAETPQPSASRPQTENAQEEDVPPSQARPASTPVPSRPRPAQQASDSQPSRPRRVPRRQSPYQSLSATPSAVPPAEVDWVAVFLGLIAVAAWGGLLPFFIWVFNNIF